LPAEFQEDLDAAVNWGDGHAYFFKADRYVRYNIGNDTVDVGPVEIAKFWTALPAEFQENLDATVNWSQVSHWERLNLDRRLLYVMERLVERYAYPVNGAAGIVGNLVAESGVIPNRVEGSAESTPMRSKNFGGTVVNHTADDIMNRSAAHHVGPALPGIGLAQWTSSARRARLFTHPFGGDGLGARAVFNMDGQVDYLANELRTGFSGVQALLTRSTVTVNEACDEVVYNFEVPGAILQGGTKLPRSDQRVQQVFAQRRLPAKRALNAYRAVHP
ncbi:phage tail tip lysozyme, partial [Streptomyces sp. NPDC021080]|uniref:phage tail tip lysozyme n=1 Tax=Streptomyces sp. NPDC021080 TaxID=3365110 RepID=UPI00378A585D